MKKNQLEKLTEINDNIADELDRLNRLTARVDQDSTTKREEFQLAELKAAAQKITKALEFLDRVFKEEEEHA